MIRQDLFSIFFLSGIVLVETFIICYPAGGAPMVWHYGSGFLYKFLSTVVFLVLIYMGAGPSRAGADTPPKLRGACAAPSDACWDVGFHQPGVNGTVYAMVRDNSGNIYVGGEIIAAGGVPVNNLAMWDGTTWRDVGGGITITAGTARVSALAVDADNNLIVGGFFTHAGGTAANNLAVWNGSFWQEVGGGVNGSVQAIKVVSGGMYVGGLFDQVGTLSANNIAYRDFQTLSWSTLGSGVNNGVNSWVNTIEETTNSVFVGGDFSTAGGTSANRIARFNGASWEAVKGGLTQGGYVNALLAVGSDLYVGGSFPQVGEVGTPLDAHNIARWDGSNWHALSFGTGGEVLALMRTATGDIILGGDFSSAGSPPMAAENVVRWNGSAWSALDSGVGTQTYEEVNALILSGTDVLAGGRFDLSGDQVVNHLARWNGSAWSAMDGGLGVNNVVDVLLSDISAVYVSGNINQFGSLQALGLAKLSGSSWSGEGTPAASFIRTLVKSSLTELIAGGAFTAIGATPTAYLARWNGAAWSELAGGTNGPVNALTWRDGKLYVGGEFTTVGGGNPANRVALWDGTWHTLGEGLNGTVHALALDALGNLYVAGEFTQAGGQYANRIARWDGSQWHALGGGLSGNVYALTFDGDGRLYAGGYFGYAGDKQANGVAVWNGLEWSALESGLDDGVGALAVDASGYLYAGGDFQSAGDAPAAHIARWDGFTWSPLGSGADSNVRALALAGNRLLVGGIFKKTGGIPSSYLGAYTFPPPAWAPAPTLANLFPAGIPAGGAGFWLEVNGTNFSSRSVVYWNGIPLTTTYLSGSRLRAFVPADKVGTPGTATILVSTPASNGGGSSLTKTFEILDGYRIYLPAVLR
jgi:trimeric autotransporter adhesin